MNIEQKLDPAYSPNWIVNEIEAGRAVDLSDIQREERLSIINDFLSSQGLRSLEGLGDATKGQMEFVGINNFSPDNFVARVDFQTAIGENTFNHLNFISANTDLNTGVITVPIIQAKGSDEKFVVLVKQFRPVVGRETIELTRGFPDPDDFLASKPVHGFFRELGEETGIEKKEGVNFEVEKVPPIYENTGTHNVQNSVAKITITVSKSEMEAIRHRVTTETSGHQLKTLLVPVNAAFGLLEDQHSLAALAKATK